MLDISNTVFTETLKQSKNSSTGKDFPSTNVNYTLTVPIALQSNYKKQFSNDIQIECMDGHTLMVRRFNYNYRIIKA